MKSILERIRESLRLNECGGGSDGGCGSSSDDDYDYSCGGGKRKRSGRNGVGC